MNQQELNIEIPEELEGLIPDFMRRREVDIEEFKRMVSEEDFEGIRLLAHKIKGHGGGYGLYVLTELGAEIETASRDRDINRTRIAIERFEITVRAIKRVLKL